MQRIQRALLFRYVLIMQLCHYVIQMYDAHPHNHTIDTRFIRTLYCPDPFLLVFLMLIASALLGINCLIMGGGTSCSLLLCTFIPEYETGADSKSNAFSRTFCSV
eukprot:358512_1